MDYVSCMDVPESSEKATEIGPYTIHRDRPEEVSKVIVPHVGKNNDDLIEIAKGCNKL